MYRVGATGRFSLSRSISYRGPVTEPEISRETIDHCKPGSANVFPIVKFNENEKPDIFRPDGPNH